MSLVMSYLRWWNLLLMPHEFCYFLIKGIPLFCVLFLNCCVKLAALKLGVLICFGLIDACERVKEIIILDDTFSGNLAKLI